MSHKLLEMNKNDSYENTIIFAYIVNKNVFQKQQSNFLKL